MLLIILYVILGAGVCYWGYICLKAGTYASAALILIVPFFLWRMIQSFWKQKLWALPIWGIIMIPLLTVVFVTPNTGIMIQIIAAWSFLVAALAMIICYRDGRPLKQAP